MNIPSQRLAREAVLQLAPYQPGKPMEDVARELGLSDVIKLASNESPLGPSPRALEAIREALPRVHLYPDGAGYLLKRKLAEKFGLDTACFTLGNGSSDILWFVLWAFVNPGDEVLTAKTTFLMYPILAKVAHARLVEVPLADWCFDLEAMEKKIRRRTKVIFLCNPNNPTGTIIRKDALEKFLSRIPDSTIVVLDEAYVEFVEDAQFPDSMDLLKRRKNIVVLRTFSKIVGLAGLRIGYGISSSKVADWLNRVRPPFNTNSLAQAAAVAALDDEEHIAQTKALVREGREFLTGEFQRLGLSFVPSWTNFIVVCVSRSGGRKTSLTGDKVFERLLKRGVIVRSMKAYGMPQYIRVSVGTRQQNQRFVEALEGVLHG